VFRREALINIVSHGVGGDYLSLSLSSAAHSKRLNFPVSHSEINYVDSFTDTLKYKNKLKREVSCLGSPWA